MSVISEIVAYLDDQNVGTTGENLFYSHIPDDSTNDFLIGVYDRDGLAPDIDILEIKSPMFQVFIRSKTYDIGKTKLTTIRELLHGVINRYLVVNGIYFRKIHATSEGGHLGLNPDNNKHEFSINFMTQVIE